MSNARVCFLIERQNASSYTDTLMFLKIFKDCNYKGLIVHGNNYELWLLNVLVV